MTKTPHLSSLWWIRSPVHPSIALRKEEMAAFINLEDSPMFRKQMYSMEHTANELKDRCQKLQKGCKRFVASLNEAYEGDFVFADYLEAFGAGQDDPVSVSIGGPVMSRFTTAFREISTYKELLRSQVEHMLSDRLMQFMSTDMQNVKECRRRFDKASQGYDQTREKFMSLKKGTRSEVVFELEEELHNSKSEFEKCRFNLVTALANVDAKKKYEFLESISATMDAHMRYFKQGYELLSQMEPFVHQVLTYAQQSKEMANAEQDNLVKRIQEFRTQAELASLRSLSHTEASTSGDGIHIVGVNSYKNIEAIMQSTANGEVKTIKQGYLLKLSSSLRGDWKRRFFVLDSYGTLYYYRTKWNSKPSKQPDEDDIGCRTVDLRTSTIKIDAEQSDLRFCFRIISPSKTLTLQAETAMDRREWVDKITGVIASLINSPFVNQGSSGRIYIEGKSYPKAIGYESSVEDTSQGHDNVARELRGIPGNDICAECGAPEPDWASLNLGILICIECSGVHRNLGVHISKVRSLTLDVKVWEPTMLDLFRALGNSYCNSVWEGLILLQEESETGLLSKKPGPRDTIAKKEMYIHLKYAEKMLIVKEPPQSDLPPPVLRAWEAVKTDNVQATYHLIVASDVNANTKYEEVSSDVIHLEDDPNSKDIAFCTKFKDSSEPDSCMQGCTLLHLACHGGDPVMMELLLQFGADIDIQDYHGRTPLHHCILTKNNALAKYLLKRGARTSVRDGGGLTAIERAMELGSITDEELFLLLTRND